MEAGWILGQILGAIVMFGLPVFVILFTIKEFRDQRRWERVREMYRYNIEFIEQNWDTFHAVRPPTTHTHNWRKEGF